MSELVFRALLFAIALVCLLGLANLILFAVYWHVRIPAPEYGTASRDDRR